MLQRFLEWLHICIFGAQELLQKIVSSRITALNLSLTRPIRGFQHTSHSDILIAADAYDGKMAKIFLNRLKRRRIGLNVPIGPPPQFERVLEGKHDGEEGRMSPSEFL